MKKKICVLSIILLVLLVFGGVKVNAEELTTTPTTEPIITETTEPIQDEETIGETVDKFNESMEYYVKLFIQYVVGVGGSLTGLLIILKKILKALKDVKDKSSTLDELKKVLDEERETLTNKEKEFVEATQTLINSLSNVDELNKFKDSVDKIINCLTLITDNDSKLVASGVSKRIHQLLETEASDNNEQ